MLRNLFLLILLYSFSSFASEEESKEMGETIIVHPNPDDDWLFGFHDTISDSVFGSAVWFDKFFATDEDEELLPETLARIRLGYEPRAREFDVFSQRFRLRLRLPHLESKVDLILTDEEDGDDNDLVDSSRTLTGDGLEDSFTAAIRVVNVDKLSKFVDTRIGISGGDIFAKVRAKIQSDSPDIHVFKFQPSIFYYLDDGFGTRLFFEYDYNFAEKQQFRANYSIRTSEAFDGYRWRNGYYYLQQHDRYTATALGFVIKGEDNGDKGYEVENYTLSYRYRVNTYRRWLYFEIEPFVEWPEDQSYKATPGIALRVEGYFKDN